MTAATKQPNLMALILADLRRHLSVLVLALLCLLSAFAVIFSSHLNRDLNAELEALVASQDSLGIEWRHLLLEENALAEHSRIERLATRKLDMGRPRPEQEVVVTLP